MPARNEPRVFVAKVRPLEEFSGSSSITLPKKLFETQPRLRKFSKKPPASSQVIQPDGCWKINRDQEEFCIDSPLRVLCGQAPFQVTFVSLEQDSSSKIVPNSLTVRFQGRKIIDEFYSYAANILFPTLHNVAIEASQTRSMTNNDYWSAFLAVNEQYAKCISEHAKNCDIILILDYELLMLPWYLAKYNQQQSIIFLFKTPFPTSEIFRCLPQREEILKSLLKCSLINFFMPSHSRHFFSACTRILGADSDGSAVDYLGQCTKISYEEFSLDTKYIDEIMNLQVVSSKAKQIAEYLGGKFILFGIDGISQQASVLHKLKALSELLKNYPIYRTQITLVQICYPEAIHKCTRDLRIAELASQINSTYGTLECPVVHYFEQNIDFDEYFGLASISDCYLDASESQIFNPALFEFIYCQQKKKKSPLILSKMSHWSKSLSGSIICNPWDHEGLADAIHLAYALDQKQREKLHEKNFDYVKNSCTKNIFIQLTKTMQQIKTDEGAKGRFTKLTYEELEVAYKKSQKRLFILDYDGTLVSIKNSPLAANPTEKTIEVLTKLGKNPNNVVFVVSGRDKETLSNWLGNIPTLGLSAEHGSFVKFPYSFHWYESFSSVDSMDWKGITLEILNYFTERTPGTFVEHKQRSLCWHYRRADPEFGSRQAKECQLNLESSLLSKYQVEILPGKKVIEVRSAFCNKGICITNIIQHYSQLEFVFCAGDDRTDEDMFRVLENASTFNSSSNRMKVFTCIVGSSVQRSIAKYRTEHPESLLNILAKLS